MEKKAPIAAALFAFAGLFFLALPAHALGATLSLSPSSGRYFTGRAFTVSVYVSSPDTAVNAVQGVLFFPQDKLAVISVAKSDSIITLWIQDPSYSNIDGTVSFGGVAVNPGFKGASGKVLTITFRVKNPGAAPISFVSGSVLANDGQGTNILSDMQGARMVLAPAPAFVSGAAGQQPPMFAITSVPAVTDGRWYNFNSIAFQWQLPGDADAVNYAFSSDPDYRLPQTPLPATSSISYNLAPLDDGTWYFFASYESGGVWSPPAMRTLKIDHSPPDPFIIVEKDTDLGTNGQGPVFQWAATDNSGIDHYMARIGSGDWFDPSSIEKGSLYALPPQSPTNARTLTVRAYDAAGNFTEAAAAFSVARKCSPTDAWCGLASLFSEWNAILTVSVAGLFMLSYWLIFRVYLWRKKFRDELLGFREGLHHDLRWFERQLDEGGANPPLEHLEEKKSLKNAMEHMEEDVEEEIKKLEKQV